MKLEETPDGTEISDRRSHSENSETGEHRTLVIHFGRGTPSLTEVRLGRILTSNQMGGQRHTHRVSF